jgi:hypothetical protein
MRIHRASQTVLRNNKGILSHTGHAYATRCGVAGGAEGEWQVHMHAEVGSSNITGEAQHRYQHATTRIALRARGRSLMPRSAEGVEGSESAGTHPAVQFQAQVREGTQLALVGLAPALSQGRQKEEDLAPPVEYRPTGHAAQRRT